MNNYPKIGIRPIIDGRRGGISYGHIGADLISLASMLSIPVCMHNVEETEPLWIENP